MVHYVANWFAWRDLAKKLHVALDSQLLGETAKIINQYSTPHEP
jgi:hypothetical protein